MDLRIARERLLAERTRLVKLHEYEVETLDEAQGDATGELTNYDQHPADAANETFERERDLSIAESLERELQLIDEALERVDAGTYGRCEVCDRPIDEERLAARSMARFCVEHQEEAERLGRAESGPELGAAR